MLVRRIARPLLSTIFIAGGIEALRRPGGPAKRAEPLIDLVDEHAVQPLAQKVAAGAAGAVDDAIAATADIAEDLPNDSASSAVRSAAAATHDASAPLRDVASGKGLLLEDETYVRINAAIQVGAGLLLATGRAPRIASATLAATLIPTTAAGHRFWEAEGAERQAQQIHFMKNVSLLGGLLLAAADTEGKPGLAWKAKHLRQGSEIVVAATRANAKVAAKAAKADAKAVKRLAQANAKVAGKGGKLGVEIAGDRAAKGLRSARRHAKIARVEAAAAGHLAADRAADLAPKVQAAGHVAAERASDLAPKVQAAGAIAVDRAAVWGQLAHDRAMDLAPQVQAIGQRAAELAPQVVAAGHRAADALPSRS